MLKGQDKDREIEGEVRDVGVSREWVVFYLLLLASDGMLSRFLKRDKLRARWLQLYIGGICVPCVCKLNKSNHTQREVIRMC